MSTWDDKEITPTALKRVRRNVRKYTKAYVACRRQLLDLKAQGAPVWDREDAAEMALTARYDLKMERARLARCEARTVVKGAHVCPAARERLIRNGTWKAET